jgi:hypothetical protein
MTLLAEAMLRGAMTLKLNNPHCSNKNHLRVVFIWF